MESLANTMIVKDAMLRSLFPKASDTRTKIFANILKFNESANEANNLVFYKEGSDGSLQFGFKYGNVVGVRKIVEQYNYAMICFPNRAFFSDKTSVSNNNIFKNGEKRIKFISLTDCEYKFNDYVLLKPKFFDILDTTLITSKSQVSIGNSEYGQSIPGAYCLLLG